MVDAKSNNTDFDDSSSSKRQMEEAVSSPISDAHDVAYRLDSFVGKSGLCSRRKAKQYIQAGRVRINGTIVQDAGYRVYPARDTVKCGTQHLQLPDRFVYYAFHKPVKVESTNKVQSQNAQRISCLSYLRVPLQEQLFSVGRLDYLSSGLLLFTNNGELCHRLTHPRFEIPKIYRISTREPIPPLKLNAWKQGIEIGGIRYTLKDFTLISEKEVDLCLVEGKNREIRKVLASFSLHILTLCRTHFAGITLHRLKPGEFRFLSKKEVFSLYSITNII